MGVKWEGSFQNRLMELSKCPDPVVGMGATEILWTDRNPWEIIKVIDDRHIIVRELDSFRTDGHGPSDAQEYEYNSNPENRVCKLFKTKDGRWRERLGRHGLGSSFILGFAEKYYDYSF